jgi:predicted amidohydrolase
LCSFAPDEDWLHLPVRAAENKVFVIAANKVGRLVPEGLLDAIAGDGDLQDVREMMGGGASQIVAPDGTVLAHAPVDGEAVVWADIDLNDAKTKRRPDGSDIFADRRPELYGPIVSQPEERMVVAGADRLDAAVWRGSNAENPLDEAVEAVRSAIDTGVQILVLPELAFLPDGEVTAVSEDYERCSRSIDQVSELLAEERSGSLVATSIIAVEGDDIFHQGVVIGKDGVVLRQSTLHRCGRHPWVTTYGDDLVTLDTKMARIALVAGGDAAIPETFRLLALLDVEVVAVPTRILEPWESKTGFLERAAENRQSVVVATRPTEAGTGMIVTLEKDFTQGTTRADGQRRARTLSWPIAVHADRNAALMRATIYPSASANRLCFVATDLVAGRPWHLAGAIAGQPPHA